MPFNDKCRIKEIFDEGPEICGQFVERPIFETSGKIEGREAT